MRGGGRAHQPRELGTVVAGRREQSPKGKNRPQDFPGLRRKDAQEKGTGSLFSVLGDDLTLMGKGCCWTPGSGLSCPEEASVLREFLTFFIRQDYKNPSPSS